jgi:hypothetical protein
MKPPIAGLDEAVDFGDNIIRMQFSKSLREAKKCVY